MSDVAGHWDRAYGDRGATHVSWYEPTPRVSLEIISGLGVRPDAPVVDVGGGTSALAGELVARGFTDVTVLDLSEAALRDPKGQVGAAVRWLHQDILRWQPERQYRLWHDRAVLHFFTEDSERNAYLHALDAGVAPGGFVVLGVFAPGGPERCSGLPVRRYSPDELARFLGHAYLPRIDRYDIHVTPRETRQAFTWAAFERV